MGRPPKVLGGAHVLVWAELDGGALAVGVPPGPVPEYCLFRCDRGWQVHSVTRHDTLELAQRQAEADHAGVSGRWRTRA